MLQKFFSFLPRNLEIFSRRSWFVLRRSCGWEVLGRKRMLQKLFSFGGAGRG
jgi:hypothetical protein